MASVEFQTVEVEKKGKTYILKFMYKGPKGKAEIARFTLSEEMKEELKTQVNRF